MTEVVTVDQLDMSCERCGSVLRVRGRFSYREYEERLGAFAPPDPADGDWLLFSCALGCTEQFVSEAELLRGLV